MGRLYGQEPDNLVLDAYWLALRAWDFADFETAAGHLMATAKFMPRPADFNALRKAGERTAAEAWNAAIGACSQWRYGHVTVNSRTDKAVAALGGYRALAMADEETALPHMMRRFCQIYDELTDVETARIALPGVATDPNTPRINHGMQQVSLGVLDSLIDDEMGPRQ